MFKTKLTLKLLVVFAFIAGFALLSTGTPRIPLLSPRLVSGATEQAEKTPTKTIRVGIKQLDTGGLPTVTLRCEDAELSAPNAIEKLACVIRNNTQTKITAGTLRITVNVRKDGKTLSTATFDTFDTFLHPDFLENRKSFIPPEGEYRLNQLPSTYDDAVITGISAEIDYIELVDKSGLGPNKRGAYIIASSREGASKYRAWLADKYSRSGRSNTALVRLLDQDSTDELQFQSENEEHGADMYRKFARRLCKDKGAESFTKHLK